MTPYITYLTAIKLKFSQTNFKIMYINEIEK